MNEKDIQRPLLSPLAGEIKVQLEILCGLPLSHVARENGIPEDEVLRRIVRLRTRFAENCARSGKSIRVRPDFPGCVRAALAEVRDSGALCWAAFFDGDDERPCFRRFFFIMYEYYGAEILA